MRSNGNLRIVMLVAVLTAALVGSAKRGWAQNLPESPQVPDRDPSPGDGSQLNAGVGEENSHFSQKQGEVGHPSESDQTSSGPIPSGPTSSGQSSFGQSSPGQSSPGETSSGGQSSQNKPSPDKKDESPNRAQDVEAAARQAAHATLGQLRDWETEWLVGAYVGRNRQMVTLTGKQREKLYLQQTVLTPGAYLKRAFDAGFDQARGVPAQWDDGVAGYMERWWSREGQFIAANSLAAWGDAKLHYEPRYDQCRCRGFWPRMRHAAVRNFITYDRSERDLRPQWALYGGAFGGGLIATAWKPKPLNPFVQGGYGMLGQAGWGVLTNFFTEFAVDINRKLGAKR